MSEQKLSRSPKAKCHSWPDHPKSGWFHCQLCTARCTRGRDGKIMIYAATADWRSVDDG